MDYRFSTIFCALFVLGSLCGQEAAVDIAQAVRDLGAPAFEARERARKTLAELGCEAKAELEQAAKHPDPEVSGTARQLLRDMLPGVRRDTPERQRRLVAAYVAAGTPSQAAKLIGELRKERPLPPGMLQTLLNWQTDRQQRQEVVERLLQTSVASRRWLLADGGPESYEFFVNWAMREELKDQIPWLVSQAYHRSELNEMRQKVAALVSAWASPFRRQLLIELHLLAGHEDEAVAVAREWGDWPFLEKLLARTCKWEELARELAARVQTPTGLQGLQLAAAQRLAGQHELAAATLRQVMAYDKEGSGVRLVEAWAGPAATSRGGDVLQWQGIGRRLTGGSGIVKAPELFVHTTRKDGSKRRIPLWQCLLAYGMTGDALQALISQQNDSAMRILLKQGRAKQADTFLRAAMEGARPLARRVLAVRRVGLRRDRGDDTAMAAAREILEQCRTGEMELADPRTISPMARALCGAGFHGLVVDALPDLLARLAPSDERGASSLAWFLAPGGFDTGFWWDRLAQADPKLSVVARARRLGDFQHGRLPPAETERILRLGLRPEAAVEDRVPDLLAVAETSAWIGRQAEAEAAFALALRYAAELPDMCLRRSVWDLSQGVLAPVAKWSELVNAWGHLALEEEPDDLLQQASFLVWGGDRGAGRKQFERAVSMALVGDAEYLFSPPTGVKWQGMRRALSLAVSCPVKPRRNMLRAAREMKDYALELRLAQRLWYGQVCRPTSTGLRGNADLAFAECRAMVADGELARALARAKQVCDAFPYYSGGVADTVTALEEAGAKEEADELVAHALSRQRDILERLPNSADRLGSFARLCARTGRELAEGEACARKAITVIPWAVYRHATLALVLYRKGDVEEALELARECVRRVPGHRPFVYQLGRWLQEQKQKQ